MVLASSPTTKVCGLQTNYFPIGFGVSISMVRVLKKQTHTSFGVLAKII
jgi:hypothetical protein